MGAPANPLILSQRSRIVRFAVEHRIPAMYEFREFVSDGGLLSYGPNLMEMFRGSATYADRILNGAKPSDIPIERPTKFELSVNLKAAKALGLTIPQSLLLRADQVIE
jgi:putative ABC transport system substrate-binding protein